MKNKTSATTYLLAFSYLLSACATFAAADLITGPHAVSAVSNDFANVKVYPNPWRVDRNNKTPIKFEGLPQGSTVKIFTVSGRWVSTLASSGDPASAQWMATNEDGDSVASGIYLYLITAGNGQTSSGKLAIIK